MLKDGGMDGFAVAQIAVQQNGQPIGEKLDELYFDEANALLTLVNEVNGLGDKGNG